MELKGKTALITGAARRIGREIALTLGRCGALIIIHYHHSQKDARDLQKELEAQGTEAFLVRADFSARSHQNIQPLIRDFVKKVYRQVPRIDVLVNNASVFYPVLVGKVSEAQWDENLTVNLKAPYFLSQEIGMRMVRQKQGKIVNLVDWTALHPAPRFLPYGISKAGLWAATTGLAKAFAPYVQVNGIHPGPILPAKGLSSAHNKAAASRTLLKRFGTPQDIARAVRFLCEDSDYITGAVIPVDGGASIL